MIYIQFLGIILNIIFLSVFPFCIGFLKDFLQKRSSINNIDISAAYIINMLLATYILFMQIVLFLC